MLDIVISIVLLFMAMKLKLAMVFKQKSTRVLSNGNIEIYKICLFEVDFFSYKFNLLNLQRGPIHYQQAVEHIPSQRYGHSSS